MGISALFGLLKSKSTSSSSTSHLPSGDRIMEPVQLPLALDSDCNGDCKGEDNESRIEQGKESNLYVYDSPYASVLKRMQVDYLISIPIVLIAGPMNKSNVFTFGACGALCMIGVFANYPPFHNHVHQLRWQPGSDQFEVDKASWFGIPTTRTIKFSDIRPPWTTEYHYHTFRANGESYHLSDPHLYRRLVTGKFPDMLGEDYKSVLSEDAG